MRAELRPLTFLVTALNEEEHIEETVATIVAAVETFSCDYEILLVDDGSTDGTARIADALATRRPRVRVVHNERNLGLGGAYKRGIHHASKEYVMWVSGDNAETADNLINIISHVGEADIVVPVLVAPKTRPWLRRLTSRAFTFVVNSLFGLKVHYYNGSVVHRCDLIRQVDIRTNSFAYQAESLVKLLKQGYSYVEVPYTSATYDGVFSHAMRPKNLLAVFKALIDLNFDLRKARRIKQPSARD
jgi:glycosyltransferase involved in cell wall biosynthesis